MTLPIKEIHLGTLSLTAILIIIADYYGYQYFSGKKETLSIFCVKFLHYAVVLGLLLMILSGILLTSLYWEHFIQQPFFIVKMLMVGALVANSFVIGKLMHVATEKPFAMLEQREKRKLFISGGVSVFCWIGATVIGMFFL